MSDIRTKCNINCIAHEEAAYTCDSGICLKHKAYQQGYQDGGSDMEQAKQIIIDGLLKQIEQIRAEVIDDYTEWLRKSHANFDEDYAEDIKSYYLEWLKEQK